jgi:hypothetical protein
LAGAPREMLGNAGESALRRAVAEYVAAQQLNADRPEAHLNLANLLVRENSSAAQRFSCGTHCRWSLRSRRPLRRGRRACLATDAAIGVLRSELDKYPFDGEAKGWFRAALRCVK